MTKPAHPKSAATHQPRGTVAPRTGVNVRGDGQQGGTRGSSVGEGALNRCAPRDRAGSGRRSDGGGDAAGSAKGPQIRNEVRMGVNHIVYVRLVWGDDHAFSFKGVREADTCYVVFGVMDIRRKCNKGVWVRLMLDADGLIFGV